MTRLRNPISQLKRTVGPIEGAAETLRRVDRAMHRVPAEPVVPSESSRFDQLVANAPIGVYRTDANGKLLDGNLALARMLGRLSLEELLAENGTGPFSSSGRSSFWARLAKEGEVNGFESDWTRGDGTKVYCREHARAVHGANREPIGYEGTLEDISDRRAAERQIKKERDFSSAVIDTAASPVLILDREGRVVRFNQSCENLSGFNFHDIAEKSVWDAVTAPEHREKSRAYFQQLLNGAFPSSHESTWVSRDGKVRRIAWSDSALLDEAGTVQNIISMGVDITERTAAEAALRHSEARYRELFECASDIVFQMGVDGTLVSINAATERLTGYSRSELHHISQVLEPDQLEVTMQRLAIKLSGGGGDPFELRIRDAGGRYLYVDLNTTVRYENGQPVGILGIARDITWRRHLEESERGRRNILEMTARHEPLENVMAKLARWVEANFSGAVCSIELSTVLLAGAESQSPTIAAPVFQKLEQGSPEWTAGFRARWQLPVLSRERGQLALLTILTPREELPSLHENEVLASKVRLATLAIEHHLMTDGIQWTAYHDKLTGLGNRELLERKLRSAIAESGDGHQPFAVFFIDLDRFKLVNDTLGHEVGDLLIHSVGKRLVNAVGPRGFVARMGADEFTILVNPVWSREEADKIGQQLLECFETAFEAAGHELFASASIGCSMYPWDGEDAQTLRRNADTAMYRAKASGRNRFVQFAPMMTAGLARRLKIQNELHRALDRGELQLYYQPQHDLKDDRMIGVEGLLRWTSRDLGPVSPGEFIPVAEESGLIVGIGNWVIREACRQCRIWSDAGHPIKVAVNVSAWQFARPDFFDIVENALQTSGIPPALLELELTESVLMQESGESIEGLDRLRSLGVLVSIDDFGTGYSSLAYLQRLPIQSLKIDLSFVRMIPETEEVPPLIRAITALARGLNIGVLAEGVEKFYQARVLQRAGCDRVQGYLYGRPAPAGELTRLLATDCRPSSISAVV